MLRRMSGAAAPPGSPAGIPPVDVEGVPMRATPAPPTRRSPQQTTAPATETRRSGASRSRANGAATDGPSVPAAWLRSPLLLGAAVVVVGAGAAWAVWVMQRRRTGRGCCPPDTGAGQTVTGPTKATEATKEAPHR